MVTLTIYDLTTEQYSAVVSNIIAAVALLLSVVLFFLRFYDHYKSKNQYFANLTFNETYRTFCQAHTKYLSIKYPKRLDLKEVIDSMNSFSNAFVLELSRESHKGKQFIRTIERYEESICYLLNKKTKDEKDIQRKNIEKRFRKIRQQVRKFF